MSIVC